MKFSPHPVTLRQLQYAVAVAEAKSFRRAAERCHVAQPSLSAQIAELETMLDVRLFERTRRHVLTTAAGEELVMRARRVLIEVEDLAETAKQYVDPLKGTLRIGIIPTIGPYLLPEIDPALRKAFNGLTLVWTEDKTEVLVDRIARGELDAAVLALEAELADLDTHEIAPDPFVLAMAQDHKLASSSHGVRLRDLKNEQVLLLDDGHCFREQALELCSAAGAKELGFRATSLPTLAQMVAAGNGITLLPSIAVDVENRHALLAIRRFAAPIPRRTIVLAFRKHSALANSLHAVAETARKVLAEARTTSPDPR